MRNEGLAAAMLVVAITLAAAQAPPDEFHAWLRTGNTGAIAAALDKDPGAVGRPDGQGAQPLFWAAVYGQQAVVDLLLARGADPNAGSPFGTAVHGAVFSGRPDIIRVLAARGADLNNGGTAGVPALVFAARRGLAAGTTALLDAGVKVDARDAAGNTALLLAASYGHASIVRALLARRADPSTANTQGVAPLEAATREGHTRVVETLRAAGAVASAALRTPTGEYLGQAAPREARQIFAPRFISTERRELNAAFTPDGRTFFFSRDTTPRSTGILMTTLGATGWQPPVLAPFGRADAGDVDMFVSADGSEVYFCSERPTPIKTAPQKGTPAAGQPDSDIWVARRQGAGWVVEWLGPEVNAVGANDYYPTLTGSGALYFSSNRPGGLGQNDIYRVRRVNGKWTAPENLGAPINTAGREFDPFIAPDESYLIFASERAGGLGESDLYVSTRKRDGSWETPINLGPGVNSATADYTPMLSPDGRFLFLTSGAAGSDDLYWVAASVIRKALDEGMSGGRQRPAGPPSTRAGNRNTARTKASTPSTANPRMRKGSSSQRMDRRPGPARPAASTIALEWLFAQRR